MPTTAQVPLPEIAAADYVIVATGSVARDLPFAKFDGDKVWVANAGRSGFTSRRHVVQLRHLLAQGPRFDIVLLLMKAYDTRWACQLIEPYLKPDGLVAGVQNGMTVDTVAAVVGPARTMGCVIEISSMMFDPGIVQRHSPPSRSWFAVGSIDPATAGRERRGDIREPDAGEFVA